MLFEHADRAAGVCLPGPNSLMTRFAAAVGDCQDGVFRQCLGITRILRPAYLA